MDKEIEEIIKKHYKEIKAQVKIEKTICGDIPALCDSDRVDFLEKLIVSYEKIFPFLKNS